MSGLEWRSTSRPGPGGTFVGRRREYLELLSALDETLGGRAQLRLLEGEAGIGKTRLVAELAAAARARGVPALWAACESDLHAPPYCPWSRLMRAALEPLSESERERLLEGVADDLAPLVESPAGAWRSSESAEARFRLFDDVALFWRRYARKSAALLVLDDLQEADAGSIDLLGFVARQVAEAPLLFVATRRDSELRVGDDRGARIAELRAASHTRLGGLEPDDVGVLVAQIAGEPPSRDLAHAIHARTGGNPFFVDAVTRLVLSAGPLATASGAALRLPVEVQSAIRRRLAGAPPDLLRALASASALGREFDLALLAATLGEPRADLCRLLETPAARLALEPVDASRARFRVSHALVQETLYDHRPAEERAGLHERIALVLEARPAPARDADAAALAHHFLRATARPDTDRKAIAYSIQAGLAAQSSHSCTEAVRHFDAALGALARASDPRRELDCRLALASARAQDGQLARAHEQSRLALALERELGDGDGLARAALHLARGGENGFTPEPERVASLREALAAIDARPSPTRVLLLSHLAQAIYFSDQSGEAVRLGHEALALARELRDPSAICAALDTLRWLCWAPGNARQRLALCDEQLARASEIDSLVLAGNAHYGRAEIRLELGDLASARAALEALQDTWRVLRMPIMRWGGELLRSLFAVIDGRLDDAESHARRALAVGESIDARLALEWFAVQQILIRSEQGRDAEILPALRRLAEARPQPQVRAGLARVLARAGAREEARALLDVLCAELPALRRDVSWPFTLASLAEASHVLGEPASASRIYADLSAYDGHQVILGLKLGWLGPVARFLGLCAWSLGDRERARAHLAVALAQCRKLGAQRLEAQLEGEVAQLGGVACREAGAHRLGPRRAVLRRVGEYWEVGWEGALALHRDAKGFHYLLRLIADSGREHHAIDLVNGDARARRAVGGDAGPALDARARAEYQRRVVDLRAELAVARRSGDLPHAERAREELALISRELGRRTGLGGRSRRESSASERARVNATRTLGLALRRIEVQTPDLGRLLRRAVHSGTWFRYLPDPGHELEWLL